MERTIYLMIYVEWENIRINALSCSMLRMVYLWTIKVLSILPQDGKDDA